MIKFVKLSLTYHKLLFQCVMASTVIVALDGLFAQIFTVPDLWYNRRPDFVRFADITNTVPNTTHVSLIG
jgi:hypothetical protein